MSNKRKLTWTIHYVSDHVPCEICGEQGHKGFLPGICNAHTHNIFEQYHHPDLQVVIDSDPQEAARILNTIGLMIQAGKQFKSGELIFGIYLDCPVRLGDAFEDGRHVLRVIIPDAMNRFPENPDCQAPYAYQLFDTALLSTDFWERHEKE